MENRKNDISDDQLDELFRRSAEELYVEFEPVSWQKLSKKLDAAGVPDNSLTWKKWTLLLLTFILIFSSGYWYVNSGKNLLNEEKSSKTQSENVSFDTKTSKNNTTPEANNKAISSELGKEEVQKSESNSDELAMNLLKFDKENNEKNKNKTFAENPTNSSVAKLSKNTNQPAIRDKKQNFAGSPSKSSENRESNFSTKKLLKSDDNLSKNALVEITKNLIKEENQVQNIEPKSSQSSDNQEVRNSTTQNSEAIKDNTKNTETQRLEFLIVKPLNPKNGDFESKINLPDLAFIQNPEIEQVGLMNEKSINFFKKGVSFTLQYSPDLSTVADNEFVKVGSNIGLLAEYRFARKWSLQTGLISSFKVYEAYGGQYYINLKWNVGVTPTSVNATCKMLDIPLNIRYDFTKNSHSRWFATTGVTSYIMQKEDYTFEYAQKIDGVHYSWSGKTGSYWASNLNFSLGYERQFLKKISWQVEPFARVPLKNIGYGKVKLITIGTFISLKYHL